MVIYQHYKGNVYVYIGEGVNVETGEELVYYRNFIFDDGKIFARSRESFYGYVENRVGDLVKRFTFIEDTRGYSAKDKLKGD